MRKSKVSRVIKGGLLAGLIINIGGAVSNELIFKDQWDSALKSLGRVPISGVAGLWLILMGFLMGIIMVWLYTTITQGVEQHRKAAVSAGLVTWLLVYVLALGWFVAIAVFPVKLYFGTVV